MYMSTMKVSVGGGLVLWWGGGGDIVMHGRSRMTIEPRTPTTPGRRGGYGADTFTAVFTPLGRVAPYLNQKWTQKNMYVGAEEQTTPCRAVLIPRTKKRQTKKVERYRQQRDRVVSHPAQ